MGDGTNVYISGNQGVCRITTSSPMERAVRDLEIAAMVNLNASLAQAPRGEGPLGNVNVFGCQLLMTHHVFRGPADSNVDDVIALGIQGDPVQVNSNSLFHEILQARDPPERGAQIASLVGLAHPGTGPPLERTGIPGAP